MGRIKGYGPALVAVLFAGLTALAAAVTDGRIDQAEGVQVAIQVTTVAGVWLTPAVTGWRHTKTGIAVVLAVLNAAAAGVTDGVWTSAELVNLAVAGVGVIAVRLTPPPDPMLATRY